MTRGIASNGRMRSIAAPSLYTVKVTPSACSACSAASIAARELGERHRSETLAQRPGIGAAQHLAVETLRVVAVEHDLSSLPIATLLCPRAYAGGGPTIVRVICALYKQRHTSSGAGPSPSAGDAPRMTGCDSPG